jgi:hypothetical protein
MMAAHVARAARAANVRPAAAVCHSARVMGRDVADVAAAGSTATAAVDGAGVEAHGLRSTGGTHDRSARWAAWTFAAVIAIAFPLILYQGRDQWFVLDEWNFLANRSAGSFHDLMAPHVQHWTTFGVLVYQALWWLVGLRHYWPYQLCVITLHLAAAVLLRAVMRRARVNPWIATAAASLFALFGAGRQDVVWAFQIAFTGALTFGLAHILLADHDGSFDRRDVIGIGFGLLALMCSAVGVTMAMAAGIAVLVRRGWRMAVAHTAPLAAVFVLWSATFGRDAYGGRKADLSNIVTFVREAFASVFDGLGQAPGIGVVLGLVVVVGVPLALMRQTWSEFRRFDGPTVGLALAAVSFVVTTGYARALDTAGTGFHTDASATRYVHIVAALLLPTVALAASAFVDRWPLVLPVAVALFLVGLPQNVASLRATGGEVATLGDPDLVLTMARLPLARDVPRDLSPGDAGGLSFSIGWLLDGVASGRVPELAHANPQATAAAELMLSVYQTNDPPGGTCADIRSGDRLQVRHGDVIKINGRLVTLRRRIVGQLPVQATYLARLGRTLRIVGEPLELVVRPTPTDQPAELCR